MSSLMQHHGGHNRKGGVELLMYLTKTETYASCDQCGTKQDLENVVCDGCRKPFAQRFRGEWKDGKYESNMEVLIPYFQRAPGSSQDEASIGVHQRKFDAEPVNLTRPDGSTTTCPKLYRIYRKPVGMFGCWVVFRYNNKDNVPDLSVPISEDKLPRDAKPLSNEEAAAYWFKP